MTCWICGTENTTGEHRLKRSDMKARFGHVSQRKPLFWHDSRLRNQLVKGLNVAILKFNDSICAKCNNETTKRYDKAWEELSAYLRTLKRPIQIKHRIHLAKVFPGSVAQSMLDVHLYFVKLFGCAIVENSVAISLSDFRSSLLNRSAHPNIYCFWSKSLPSAKADRG